jgi:hypothetical protein
VISDLILNNVVKKNNIYYMKLTLNIIIIIGILLFSFIVYISSYKPKSNSISYFFYKCLGPNIQDEKKTCNNIFISYKRSPSGFNNFRMQLETMISIAYITKRTLIVPPKSIVDHLDGQNIDEFDVFDWDSLSSLICLTRDEPNIEKYNIPITHDSHKSIDKSLLDKYKNEKYWYFEDLPLPSSECYIKTNDNIKKKQRRMLNKYLRFKKNYIDLAVDLLTKNDITKIGSYNSVHFRRGDFVSAAYYKDNELGNINKYNEFLSKNISNDKPLLFISDSDKNEIKTELEKKYTNVISINTDSLTKLESTIVDMILCCGSDKFIASPNSTFSIYIMILRGKVYRDCKCIDDSILYLKDIGLPTENCKCDLPSCFNYVSKDIWMGY